METLHSRIQEVDLIQLRGRLDMAHVETLASQLMPMVEHAGHCVVLDLAELTTITSSGLRLMLLLAKQSHERKGGLVLCDLRGYVLEVFNTSGLIDILPIALSRAEAIGKAKDSPGLRTASPE